MQRRDSVAEHPPLSPLPWESAEEEEGGQESASLNGSAPGPAVACQYSAFGHPLLGC